MRVHNARCLHTVHTCRLSQAKSTNDVHSNKVHSHHPSHALKKEEEKKKEEEMQLYIERVYLQDSKNKLYIYVQTHINKKK